MQEVARAGADVSVLTWNVWFDLDDWQLRFAAVADVIKLHKPTVQPLELGDQDESMLMMVTLRLVVILDCMLSGSDASFWESVEAARVASPDLPHARH